MFSQTEKSTRRCIQQNHEQLLFILILSLICPAVLQGPQVQSAEYVVKSYADFTAELQLAVVTATYDRDIFVETSCTNKSTTTQIAPCATQDDGCIDTRQVNGTLDGTAFSYHHFTVANPVTCDNVLISLTSYNLDPNAFVSFVAPEPQDASEANYLMLRFSSDISTVCCSDILSIVPTWDGSVYITVWQTTEANISYGIRVVADTTLDASEFYWLPTMELQCNDQLIFSASQCNYIGVSGCYKLPPTEDPFFGFFGNLILIENVPSTFIPRTNANGIITRSRFFSSVQTAYFRIGSPLELIQQGTCSVRYPNLQDANGEVNMNWAPITRQRLNCSAQKFGIVSEAISSIMDKISADLYLDLSSASFYSLQASVHAVRNEWLACQLQVEDSLAPAMDFEYITIENTRNCFETNGTSTEFLNDPCCNGELQTRQCCVPRTVSVRVPLRSINSNALTDTCLSPRCSLEIVNDYAALERSFLSSDEACLVDTTAALADPVFVSDPVLTCYDRVIKYPCIDNAECSRPESICLGVGYCTLPCSNDTDCVTGKCITEQGRKTCLLYNSNNANEFDIAVETLVQCFINNTNDFIRAFVLQELGLSVATPNAELRNAFEERLTRDGCQSRFALPDPKTLDQQQCESINACNWANCNDAANPLCTPENCADPLIQVNEFCQVCFGTATCFVVSLRRSCEYLSYGSTEQDCLSLPSSHWNPIARSQATSLTSCTKTVDTSAQCHSFAYCSTTEIAADFCNPKCHFPAYTDGSTCSTASTSIGTTLTFIAPGICVAAATTTRSQCSTFAGSQWWPGTFFTDSLLEDKTTCEILGYCYDGEDITLSLEDECITEDFCDGYPPFNTEPLCSSLGDCSDYDGCHTPSIIGCTSSIQIWTPQGCYTPGYRGAECTAIGGVILTKATTKAECEAKSQVCQEQHPIQTVTVSQVAPAGVSLKNASECEICGGTSQPFYKWTPYARWVPKQWTPFVHQTRNFTKGYFWTDTIDKGYFKELWNAGRSRRFSNIITSRLLCLYGASSSMLSQLACDCGTDQNGGCFSGVTEQTIRSTQVCDVVPSKIEFSQGSFEAFSDVDVVDTDCTDMPITIVPLSQFIQKRQVSLSSSAVTLSQSGRGEQAHIIKNINGVAIGEVVGSGILFGTDRDILRAQTCFNFPENLTSTFAFTKLDLATLTVNGDVAIFEPLGLDLPLDTKLFCIPFSGASAVFPIALIDEREETTFIEGLFTVEVFVIYFGAALYVAVLALWVVQFILFLQKNGIRGYFQLPTAAFYILGVALLDRLLFLFLLPVGVLEQSRVATAIFAELPALLYYTIFSLIVLSWAKIYHFTSSLTEDRYKRVKILLITMNVFIGVAFIVILIVFFSLDSKMVITCEQDLNAGLSPQEIAAIVYKAIFALFCTGLSVLFLVYGIRLIQLSNSLQTMSLNEIDQNDIKKTKTMLVKKTVVTVIGTVCLLGQAANLIRASLTDSDVFILFFIYCVELVPVVSFVIILKKAYYRKRKPQQQDTNAAPKRHIGSHYKPLPAQSHYRAMSNDKIELLGGDVAMTPIPKQDQLTNIPWSEISVQRDLGEGNFGTVSLGVWKGVQVALKRCKDPNNTEFLQEAQLMISIPHHPNVVKSFGTSQDGASMVLVMEFCNGLSLDTKLFDMPETLNNKEKLQLLIGIAHGVSHLHKNRVIHRDLAARNVLLDGVGPKISDFGLSKQVNDINEPNTTVDTSGPIRWMSPEALRGIYGAKTDIWTFGIVMYEVVTQCEPHIDEDTLFVGLKIRDQGYSPRIPAECDRALADLMTQCWNKEPSLRPDMETLCNALEAKWKSDFGNESTHS